ncbi:hypothetical protein BCON_0155g00120 [Botryotinia convoluta]|uniref:Uncharacterized protein n=1 Tax=Botryotinia convoluta TaxID=54673 RepID=A0A4Z1HRJ3_9HELO|nr:hypothetical protein BCON_0155g00120 [Botryotinia convoluta]
MKEELKDMEYEAQENAEAIEELSSELTDYRKSPRSRVANQSVEVTRLIEEKDELEARIADNEECIDIITLNEENATKIAWLEAKIAKVAAKPRTKTAAAKKNPFDVIQQAKQLQDVMRSAIRAQIKWAPSCKTSGKRWSYTCIVPSAEVFYTLFGMDAATELGAKKQWKQKKISIYDFKNIVGSCFVKILYNSLELVGKDVILRWDAGANSFTVSGKYGVTAIA